MRDTESSSKVTEKKNSIISNINKMLPRIIGETDKSPVLIGVTSIENELEKLIRDFLIDSPSGVDDLFEDGELSNFSSKISIARRLGLINNELQYAIDVMRKLRNSVTRSEFPEIYNSNQIKGLIDDLLNRYGECQEFKNIETSLNLMEVFTNEKFKNEYKANFILLVSFLYFILALARHTAEEENYRAKLIISFP